MNRVYRKRITDRVIEKFFSAAAVAVVSESMDVSGAIIRRVPCLPSAGFDAQSHPFSQKTSFAGVSADGVRLLGSRRHGNGSGFCDKGHLEYYRRSSAAIVCDGGMKEKKTTAMATATETEKPKKMMKKKLKLLKALSKDLSNFAEMGFGLAGNHGLVDEVKGKMISEASEMLLEQLQKLRTEHKQLKRQRKEQKSKLKATQIRIESNLELSSSSSSESESCDDEKQMTQILDLKNRALPQAITPAIQQRTPPLPVQLQIPVRESNLGTGSQPGSVSGKRIEVCMGGKCRKSGGAELLAEFEKLVGGGEGGGVSGCKCMGKCKEGPNVRVVEDEERKRGLPLCIGVGLGDVTSIVANFIGIAEEENLGLSPATP